MARSTPKPAGQGGHKTPPRGFNSVQSSQPGGKPVGHTPGGSTYKGIHVPGVGGSGKTISSPKSLSPRRVAGTDGTMC